MNRTQKRRDQRKRHKARIEYWKNVRFWETEKAFDEWRKRWRANLELTRNTKPSTRRVDGGRHTDVRDGTQSNPYGNGSV